MMKRLFVRALFAASLALVAYTIYAHAIAWRRSAEYRATPIAIDFASQSTLASQFEVLASPGLEHVLDGGIFRVRGRCEAAGASVVLLGQKTRLEPARASVRFRVRSFSPVDVMAGVVRVEGPARELRFGAAVLGPSGAELRFVGDPTVRGARVEGDRVLSRAAETKVAVGADALVHEVTLGLEPELLAASGSLDGLIVRETPAAWESGTLVRPAFSVTCRDPAADVDVELTQIAWQPLLRDTHAFELDDRFEAPIFDTRWRVSRADADTLDTKLRLGHGLDLTTKAKRVMGMTQVVSLVSPRVRAEPLRARLEAEVALLKQGTLYLGVSNPYVGLPFFRMLDVGVFEREGKLVPFTSGHFGDDGQPAFRTHEKLLPDLPASEAPGEGKLSLELEFEPTSRHARSRVNGVVVSDEVVALQPYEDIVFHVGLNVDAPNSEAQLRITRVSLLRTR